MNKILYVLIFLLICFGSLGAKADRISQNIDDAAYSITKIYCEPLSAGKRGNYFNGLENQIIASTFKNFYSHVEGVLDGQIKERRGTMGLLRDLTDSEGFYKALRECFPHESDKDKFVARLYLASLSAQFVQVTSTISGVRSILNFFSKSTMAKKAFSYFLSFATLGTLVVLHGDVPYDQIKAQSVKELTKGIAELKYRLQIEDNPFEKQKLENSIVLLELSKTLTALNNK